MHRVPCRPVPAVLLAALVAGAPPLPAGAGAWTMPHGEGQIITKIGRRDRPAREAEDGPMTAEPATQYQVYTEYGLADGLTVGGELWVDIAPDDLSRGSAALGAFLRKRVWQTDNGAVASMQLSVTAPVERYISEEFARSKPFSATDFGVDGLFGKSWWGDWGKVFLSTSLGYHYRLEDQPAELRGAATVGGTTWDCCLAMLSIAGTQPLGSGGSESAVTLSPSIGWHLTRDEDGSARTTVQFGASYDVLDPEAGFGLFVGLWQSF